MHAAVPAHPKQCGSGSLLKNGTLMTGPGILHRIGVIRITVIDAGLRHPTIEISLAAGGEDPDQNCQANRRVTARQTSNPIVL